MFECNPKPYHSGRPKLEDLYWKIYTKHNAHHFFPLYLVTCKWWRYIFIFNWSGIIKAGNSGNIFVSLLFLHLSRHKLCFLLQIQSAQCACSDSQQCSDSAKTSSTRPEVSCKKDVLKSFTKFTGKHLCQSFCLIKLHRPWHRCSSVGFVKILRIPFFIEYLWWLLL